MMRVQVDPLSDRVADPTETATPGGETVGDEVLAAPVAGELEEAPRNVGHKSFTAKFRRNRFAVAGLVLIILLVAVAIFAPLLAPYPPDEQNLAESLQSPSSEHWLGTDLFGRDMLSRVIYGARVSLLAGTEVVLIASVLGGLMGLMAGVAGRRVDNVLTFLNNTVLSVPGLVLAIAVVASIGAGLFTSMFAIGIVMTPRFFRVARAATKDLRHELFITGSRSIGCTRARVVYAHILPNAMPPLLIQISFVFGTAMLAEASLSYLGLGVQPPTASWGSMLSAASTRLDYPYLLWVPGIALSLAILAFALVGDGLRDAIGVGRSGG